VTSIEDILVHPVALPSPSETPSDDTDR